MAKSEGIKVRVRTEVKKKIEEIALRTGESSAEVIRDMIDFFLDNMKNFKKKGGGYVV